MFSSIKIKNFRSCADVSLENIEDILVLIGRNGAGKTNILKAIEWACYFASRVNEKAGRKNHNTMMAIQTGDVELKFSLENETYCYHVRHLSRALNNTPVRMERIVTENLYVCRDSNQTLILSRNGEKLELSEFDGAPSRTLEISSSVPCLVALQSLLAENDTFRALARKVTQFFSAVRYYPLHNYDEISNEPIILSQPYRKWKAEGYADGNSISVLQYKIIDMYLERKESFNELKSLIGSEGLGLIGDIIIHSQVIGDPNSREDDDGEITESSFYMIFYSRVGSSHAFEIDSLSFGTKRILFLLVSMLYDKSSVSLIEQPEDGVHSGLVDKIMPLFRAYSIHSQFIVASHSTAVLNRVDPQEVVIVTNRSGYTSARSMDPKELAAAEMFLEEDGPLSEFLSAIEDD